MPFGSAKVSELHLSGVLLSLLTLVYARSLACMLCFARLLENVTEQVGIEQSLL